MIDAQGISGGSAGHLQPQASWHALTTDQAAAVAEVDATRGLDAADIARRRARFGSNTLPEHPPTPAWRILARQLRSPLIAILFVAAGMAEILGHGADAGVILAVVVVNAVIGALQEGRAERSMAALRRLAALHVHVLREASESVVAARDLVPGDVLLLAAGDAVAADARLVEAAGLQLAEAALTGESVPVPKAPDALPEATGLADRRNMIYSGTHVTSGRARAVVVATGTHTEVGRIAGLTERAREPSTPLERRLERFGRWLVGAAFGLFALVMGLGVLRQMPIADILMVAISQMVSMVPEGLPVAMTIALAVGMQRMAAGGAIIRRLAAVETLGSTTVICTDKTGTLTRNEMTVVALWLPDAQEIDPAGLAPSGSGQPGGAAGCRDGAPGAATTGSAPSHGSLHALLQAAVLCNDAQRLPPGGGRTTWSLIGDPTETALLAMAANAGVDTAAVRAGQARTGELPFDAQAKLMATQHARTTGPGVVYVKGAPESVLALVSDEDAPGIDAARRAAESMATRALRVLAFGRIEDAVLDGDSGFAGLRRRVRLLGLVGEIDPPRSEVSAAVAACQRAGIRAVMVTGDHKLTGLAIARTLGMAGEGDRAIDGTELERMGEEELRDELDHIAVFARVQPAQKLRIVEAFQAQGHVVAMTGDGVNDAPALARADVGVAMGITGTEVAKSAARIVITDDNFATVVRAVEQGRVVYANLKKVILYLFATSLDEVIVLLAALLAGLPLPLVAVQILWINVVTEGTLTVNLVMDPPEGDEMHRAPVPREDRLLDPASLRRMLLMAASAAAVSFGWFAWRLDGGAAIDTVRTELFTLTVMCQWFNVLNCRSALHSVFARSPLRNRWLAWGLALSVVLQAAVLYLPAMSARFHTEPLPAATLATLVALASLVLIVEELRKALARRARLRS
jgi:magnesium-transporting ATPase (P-type)